VGFAYFVPSTLLQAWRLRLSEWSIDGSLSAAAQAALRLPGEPEALKELISQWAAGDFKALPPIEVLDGSVMPGTAGAYAISTGTIYLNGDWLRLASEEQGIAVLSEELGHHLDGWLNTEETPGDEGEHFSLLLRQEALSPERLAALRAEDDHTALWIDGAWVEVEQANIIGTWGNDYIVGSGGNDYIYAGAGDDWIFAGAGNDTINGGDGNDWIDAFQGGNNAINGDAGNDTIYAGGGNDTINGGDGIDTLIGGAGNDTYIVDTTTDMITEAANAGSDTVISSISFSLAAIANVENLSLTGSTAINGTGNTLNNVITGNSAANSLSGGTGNDNLNGGDGIDTLIGGAGNDSLSGGLGADTFQFDSPLNTRTNLDSIIDFSIIQGDMIQLSRSIFTAFTTPGTLAASAFVIGAAATTANQRILYNSATGILSYDRDGIGTIGAIGFANLSSGLALTNSSFSII
jgi:hypothetical protein